MGQESPIEPWLAPDNRAACGLRTDWLRRGKMTKTAGRENQKRCLNRAASRDHGTEGQNNHVQWGGLDGKKNSGRRRSLFSLTPFIDAGSEGRRNTCAQFTCWSLEAQSFSRALIETQRDLVQLGLRVAGKIGSLRQVLTQQTVGVFVGSSLPGAVRVTEVNFHICGYREGFVFGHL